MEHDKKRQLILMWMAVLAGLIFLAVMALHEKWKGYQWEIPEQKDYGRTLTVAADMDFEPLSYLDDEGNPKGHDVELIYALGEQMGVNIDLRMVEWSAGIEGLKNGTYDLLMGAAYETSRLNEMEFSTPVLKEHFVVFGKRSFSNEDLETSVIGILEGDVVENAVIPYTSQENIRYYSTYTQCFQALEAGECDFVYAPSYTGNRMIKELGIKQARPVNTTLYTTIGCIAAKKGNIALIEEVNQAISDMKKSGELGEIYDHWIMPYKESGNFWVLLEQYRYTIVIIILVLLLCGCMVLVYTENKNKQTLMKELEKEREITNLNLRLSETTEMLSQLISVNSCGIFAYTVPEMEILQINEEALRLFEWEDNKPMTGTDILRGYMKKIHKDDRYILKIAMRENRNPGDTGTYVFRLKKKDGGIRYVQAYVKLSENAKGQKFYLNTVIDITEKYRMENLLRRERQQYRDALLTGCDYTYTFDATEGYLRTPVHVKKGENPLEIWGLTIPASYREMVEKWIEISKPEFLGGATAEVFSCDYMIQCYKDGVRSYEVEYLDRNSQRYKRTLVLLTENEENGHIMVCEIARDITEAKAKEEAAKHVLQEAYEAANLANRAKTDFLSRMSHDIRTPMNAIIGMTSIAETHLDDRERVADCLSKIAVSSNHLLSLINEVLDMAKIESGRASLTEEEFNLSDLIEDLLTLTRPQVDEKKQTFKVTVESIEHEMVIGDSAKIQQVFTNLLSNAIKYTPEGGEISLSIKELPSHRNDLSRYQFVFRDTGIGMEPEFVKKIFEPFSRAEDSRVSKIQGTGLGMAIARNIVNMMNGDIAVESEPGKGSTFTVAINLRRQPTEQVTNQEFKNMPVLVVDDDDAVAESAVELLEGIGMDAFFVMSGEKAVEEVERHHQENNDFFAVILDWKMPGMDGLETARAIRKKVGDGVAIIVFSSYDWSDIEQEARKAGVNAFISKPLFKSRLIALFSSILRPQDGNRKEEYKMKQMRDYDYSGKRVLLVEDNLMNSEIAMEILKEAKLSVDQAWNGEEAVEKMKASGSGYYDIILMDVQMPVMNGYEATRAIRALDNEDAKRIPIIAMTANAFVEDVAAAKDAGMNEHIAKPINVKILMKMLERWLA